MTAVTANQVNILTWNSNEKGPWPCIIHSHLRKPKLHLVEYLHCLPRHIQRTRMNELISTLSASSGSFRVFTTSNQPLLRTLISTLLLLMHSLLTMASCTVHELCRSDKIVDGRLWMCHPPAKHHNWKSPIESSRHLKILELVNTKTRFPPLVSCQRKRYCFRVIFN